MARYAVRLPHDRAVAIFGSTRLRALARARRTKAEWIKLGVPGHVIIRLLMTDPPRSPNGMGPEALRWVLEIIQELYRAGDREVWMALTKNLRVFRRALARRRSADHP